jgi:K+-sensing histidine kinase KdpD
MAGNMSELLSTVRQHSAWLAVAICSLCVVILVYVRTVWVFVDENLVQYLDLFMIFGTLVSAVLGMVSLPRWQGVAVLLVDLVLFYFILFEPPYAIH